VGTVVECVRQLRIDRQRLREGGHRLLVAPEQSQHVAAIEMGLGEAGIEGNRPFEACKGLLMAVEAGQCGPPVAPIFRNSRLQHECLNSEFFHDFLYLPDSGPIRFVANCGGGLWRHEIIQKADRWKDSVY